MQITKPKSFNKDEIRKTVLKRRVLRDIAELDYKRAIKGAINTLTQVELAESLGITQPSVSSVAKSARTVQDPMEGFSGATPMEICQRYSIGELNREQLIDELSRWSYSTPTRPDIHDTLLVDSPGTFREVERAAIMGLLEDDLYEEILDRIAGRDHP